MHRSARLAAGALALAAGSATIWLALHHPLSPPVALALSVAWMALACRFARLWLFVLPAVLPAMNLSPWTGWLMVEEFDLVVLGAVAGGYARLAWRGMEGAPPLGARGRLLWAASWVGLWAITLVALCRGLADAGGWASGWFQGYADPLNSLRVSKSALYALLLAPMLRRDATWPGAGERLAQGMLAGAAVVCLAALWERLAYPGLLNFTDVYRTTALFWEMHVGGAAIDAYLALATPFVAWALWRARGPGSWALAAAFALVWVYVCLTTFARGVYLGVLSSLLLLACLRLLGGAGWRRKAGMLLGLALVAEVALVLGWGSFMASRLSNADRDYQSRTEHWARGIGLLKQPADWLFGIGAGRLPAHYDRAVPNAQFPGAVDVAQGVLELRGPRSMDALGGLYGLTQRVPMRAHYRLTLDLRTDRPTELLVRVCTVHLLYEEACQGRYLRVRPTGAAWQHLSLHLAGPPLDAGWWFAPRRAALMLTVLNAGGEIALDNLRLEAAGGESLLRNGDFSTGRAHWLPAAQYYFIPWHIDNLFLELLIERGLLGLAAFVLLLALIGVKAWRARRMPGVAPFALASLCGVLCVGLVSSVFDVPRVATLMLLLIAWWLQNTEAQTQTPTNAGPTSAGPMKKAPA